MAHVCWIRHKDLIAKQVAEGFMTFDSADSGFIRITRHERLWCTGIPTLVSEVFMPIVGMHASVVTTVPVYVVVCVSLRYKTVKETNCPTAHTVILRCSAL